jgi:hypothetical protein
MDYSATEGLRRTHPAWKLLAADTAPLVVSFLYRTFIIPNVRALPQPDLLSRLDDFLYDLRRTSGDDAPKRQAGEYLGDWSADERGWLRRYYPLNSDEPHYDLTAASEKALDFVATLFESRPVSTESRLLTVFELLRQLTEGTETNADARIAELERRRAVIDADIHRLREGHVDLMDAAQIKDRFLQLAATARGLLSDFRAVDQSFRDLDRDVRERIATWEGGKGTLLEDVFGARDHISDSDQGRSFRAFWDFLMSPARQEELTARLAAVLANPAVQELGPDRRLLRVHYDWLEAGEVAQRTVARLSEQLRRYLDDRAFLENRRIMQLIRGVEQNALGVRADPPDGPFMELDEPGPALDLSMDRPLFSPPFKPHLSADALAQGPSDVVPSDALFNQVFVDRAELAAHVRRMLQTRAQVSLEELVAARPLTLGLAELVAYLSLAADDPSAVIEDAERQQLFWTDRDGVARQATLPLVLFTRRRPTEVRP